MMVYALYFAHYDWSCTLDLLDVKAATEEMSSSDKPLQMETNRVHCALSRLVIVAIVITNIIIVIIVIIIVICVKRW